MSKSQFVLRPISALCNLHYSLFLHFWCFPWLNSIVFRTVRDCIQSFPIEWFVMHALRFSLDFSISSSEAKMSKHSIIFHRIIYKRSSTVRVSPIFRKFWSSTNKQNQAIINSVFRKISMSWRFSSWVLRSWFSEGHFKLNGKSQWF